MSQWTHGRLELDARPLLRFVNAATTRHHGVTPAHLVGRAAARALELVPGLMRLEDRRGSVDVVFTTLTPGGDLTGVNVANAGAKSAVDVAKELDLRAQWVAVGEDPFKRVESLARRVCRPLLEGLGLSATQVGSVVVTDIEALGFPVGFAPLVALPSVPFHIAVSMNRIEAGPTLTLGFSSNLGVAKPGRFADGLRSMLRYLANPTAFEPAWGAIPIRAHQAVLAE